MEWWLAISLIFGCFMVLLAMGLPVAFCFMTVNLIGVVLFFGGEAGLFHYILSVYAAVAKFVLIPIPLFILMGEVMFQSGVAANLIDALDKLLGRLPGRLGLLAVGSGAVLSVLTGTSIASTATLGSSLVPEMEKRGYKKPMSLGPILGSGGLAMMIPPSSLSIVLASIADISVADILIGGIIPGLLMAFFYGSYIIGRCWLQPSIAPRYQPVSTSLFEKLRALAKYVLPLAFIVFLVTGVIIVGVATPSEAAATGAVGTFLLAVAYGRLNWNVVKKSLLNTSRTSVMMFMIIAGSISFGQVLALSGATPGLIKSVLGLPLAPIGLIIAMQFILLILGGFMGPMSMIMVSIPVFIPIVHALGFNPVWFGILTLINMEMSVTTPPYGQNLFVMKSVAPSGTTLKDIILAALPFLVCDAIVMALVMAFPIIPLWLPGMIQ